MDPLKLLAHPVRLRIVHALRGGRTLTAGRLCARLGDVSKATVYRHLDALAEGGVIEVADERRVRGAVERHYRLRHERASIGAEETAGLSVDDHRVGFAAATAALQAEFTAYLERGQADPAADLVGYRQHAVWLSRDELEMLIIELGAAIVATLKNEATPERSQYLLSPILFPIEDGDEADGDEAGGDEAGGEDAGGGDAGGAAEDAAGGADTRSTPRHPGPTAPSAP